MNNPNNFSADPETFEVALERFVNTVQAHIKDRLKALNPSLQPDTISVDPNGVKFVRIVAASCNGRHVFCFVEKATGNVLKAEGWKRPAKGVRGTIYGGFEDYGVNQYGAKYLR